MTLKPHPLFTEEAIESKRDEALLALDAAVARLRPSELSDETLPARLADRLAPRPPHLGRRVRYRLFEIQNESDQNGDSTQDRWRAGLQTTVRFYGSADYFSLRAGAQPLHPPTGVTIGRRLVLTVLDTAGGDSLVDRMDAQLETVNRELEEQRRRCDGMRDALETGARRLVEARRTRVMALSEAARVLAARGWLGERQAG